MSKLPEPPLEHLVPTPQEEEDAWEKQGFVEKREVIRRMAQEALDEDAARRIRPSIRFQ